MCIARRGPSLSDLLVGFVLGSSAAIGARSSLHGRGHLISDTVSDASEKGFTSELSVADSASYASDSELDDELLIADEGEFYEDALQDSQEDEGEVSDDQDTPPSEDSKGICDGEGLTREKSAPELNDRCCFPGWSHTVPTQGLKMRTKEQNADDLMASLEAHKLDLDTQFQALLSARREHIMESAKHLSTNFEMSLKKHWEDLSKLECLRYDLKKQWHLSYPKNMVYMRPIEAWTVYKNVLGPMKSAINAAWNYRDSVRQQFRALVKQKAQKVVIDNDVGVSIASTYNPTDGHMVQGYSTENCVAVVFNPKTGQVERHSSSGSQLGIAAVWDPIKEKVQVQQATKWGGISGCFDPSQGRVEFRERSSCVWNPLLKKVEWVQATSMGPITMLIVAWWDSEVEQVKSQQWLAGSVSVLYHTPGGGDLFRSSGVCSFDPLPPHMYDSSKTSPRAGRWRTRLQRQRYRRRRVRRRRGGRR